MPDVLFVAEFFRKSLATKYLGVNANYQHILVVGAVEYTDAAAFGKPAYRAPEKVVLQLFRARLFETGYFATLRIDSGHDVANSSVFTGRVHSLENDQESITVGGCMQLLQIAQLLNVLLKQLLILLLA